MTINIPDRTLDNPFLNIQEMNQILQALRQSPSSRMVDSSPYGINYRQDEPYTGTICVKIDEEIPPNSIFTIKYVDQQFVAIIPTATWEKYANPATLSPSKKLVYCTNMGNPGENGSQMDCMVVGDTIPRLIRFQGTLPIIGDRLSKVVGDIVIAKNDSGEFVAVSNGDAEAGRVWVVRHYDTPTTPQSLQLLQATDWMDVGGATTVKTWNNLSGNWTLDDTDSSSAVVPLISIAQDIQHRSFLAPGDQCWGKLLGYTDWDHVAVYEVIGENGLHQYGKAIHPVNCGEETTFEITLARPDKDPTSQNVDWTDEDYDEAVEYLERRRELVGNPACPGDLDHHDVLACTPKKGCVRHIFEGEYVRLRYIVGNRKWEATPYPDTLFAVATLYAEMCPDDDALLIDFVPLGCCGNPSIVIPEPAIGLNSGLFGLAGRTGYKVLVAYTGEGNDWDVLQVRHRDEYIIEDIEVVLGESEECPTYIMKKRHFALMSCQPAADPFPFLNIVQEAVVVGGSFTKCDLNLERKLICTLGSALTAPVTISPEFEYLDVVVGFDSVDTTSSSASVPSSASSGVQKCELVARKKTIQVCFVAPTEGSEVAMKFEAQAVVHSVVDTGDDIKVFHIIIFVPCVGDMFIQSITTVDCEASSS